MFGFGKSARLKREVATLRLEKEAQDLRSALQPVQAAGTTATYPLSDPLAYEKLFGGLSNAMSADKAMTHGMVYRCVFLIAGSIAMMPLALFEQKPNGHSEKITDTPLAKLLGNRPNARLSPSMFWRSIVADMLLNGNGYAWIERKSDRSPEPKALHYIPYNRTGVRLDNIAGESTQIYTFSLDSGRVVTAHQDDVLHFPGSAIWQIFRAMSPLSAYAMATGIGISADQFAKAYFDNGSSPDGYIEVPGVLKGKEQAQEIRDDWMSHFGGNQRFAGPAIIPGGGKYVPLRINAADAQLLDSRRYSAEDICRIFGPPPHMVGLLDKSTSNGKSLAEQTQGYVDFCLGPHLKSMEDEINYKLVRQPGQVAEFDREALLRGDLKTQMEAIQIALGGNNGPGLITVDEGRRRLKMGPTEGGDERVRWPSNPTAPSPAEPEADPAPPAPPKNPNLPKKS